MTVFTAMLLDAYRELNSKKLFWITLVISGLVVISYGSIGFNEQGMSMLFGLKQIDSEFINSETAWARALYLGIFSDFVVTIWLSWVAVILALISTCTIFPDFLAGGSIDVVLSKPISRVTLFGMKYLASLLFVVLQVGLFCAGIFFCVGFRLGEWNWMIFAAIPIVTVFYSYLYAVCVLAGVLTRSAITALLLTLLFWFSMWSVQTSEGLLNQFSVRFQIEAENIQTRIDRMETSLNGLAGREDDPSVRARVDLETRLTEARNNRETQLDAKGKLTRWHKPIRGVMTVLPKTGQTVALLSRWLKDPEGFSITGMMRGDMTGRGTGMLQNQTEVEMTRRLEQELESISPWYIIGTSLGFEAVVLIGACLIFVRRDF
ncbi:MAG: hypothetical protein ACYS0D_13890 [Planctomycetota bacterium]|jgi:hypothetical protein